VRGAGHNGHSAAEPVVGLDSPLKPSRATPEPHLTKASARVRLQIALVDELGFKLRPAATVLDLGCGSGSTVTEYRGLGYDAFGCDFAFKDGPDVESHHYHGLIRLIDKTRYRLPFDDNSFDFVFSDQVFEHVRNYDETLSEIRRVLKPEGISLHFFPSRYTPIEPHVFVPLATIIQQRWWLAIWTTLGVRGSHQKAMAVREVVDANHIYLASCTNYLSKRAIARFVSRHFSDYRFCEGPFLKLSSRGRIIHRLGRFVPILPSVYSTLRARVLFFRKR